MGCKLAELSMGRNFDLSMTGENRWDESSYVLVNNGVRISIATTLTQIPVGY